jgi:hypothetical protein
MLSILLRYTDSDYPFGIFKLSINGQCILHHQSSFDSMSDSSLLPFVLYRVHVLFMLALCIYAYWCAARFPYHMMFVSFNNNTFPEQLRSPFDISGVRVS